MSITLIPSRLPKLALMTSKPTLMTPQKKIFFVWLLAASMAATDAHAYIDPGVTYAMIQGLFAVLFGATVGWVLKPWRYLKGLFGRGEKTRGADADHPEPRSHHD